MCGIRLQLLCDGEDPQGEVLIRHIVSKRAVQRRPEVHSDPQCRSFHPQFGSGAASQILRMRKLQEWLPVQCVTYGQRNVWLYTV